MNKKGAGRPEIPIDWNKVDELLVGGCTGVQVAAYIGMHPETFYDRCVKENGTNFTDYAYPKKQKGNSLLHSKQLEVALSGNVTMLIWLGKQRLGQREDPVSEENQPKTDIDKLIKFFEKVSSCGNEWKISEDSVKNSST